MTRPTPATALDELADQHAMLRELMERCEDLADAVDAGAQDASQLLDEVARLRAAFDAHNQFEEQLLRPLLLDADWMGAVRVSRMVEDHVEEHRALRRGIRATPTSELRDVIADLRGHLTAEERYLVSRKVLRDDLAG
ncbi:MAG: hemerythrin domain-containing protein [Deltaproteobacteria bacterium]|nr:MAG: hemerythrin domain-containing protein [Deltaproteobacteria bacterium]TMQ22624.1 MAG: hemerythrin domain-containing protein [Deltaproteobacteria bacterium]